MSSAGRDSIVLELNQKLLEAAVGGDWASYAALCDPSLSCFEAETNGNLVEGLDFHRFYFPDESHSLSSDASAGNSVQVTMARPHLRWLSDDAVVISYTRLVQRTAGDEAITSSCCETRIWQQQNNNWKLVHVHRS